MADVESNINVNIDTSNALASIRRLQSEISAFHTSMAKGGAAAAATSAQLQQGLINSVNATGNFSASMTKVKSTTEAFTTSLEKNKFSLGEYFRYAGASTKTFGKLFQNEMATIDKVARERVKDLQTQYIKLGRDASGAMKSIAIRPLTLDLEDLGTKTAMAAQKQQLFNQLMKQGSTNLLNFGKNTQWAGRQLMVGFSIPLGIAGAAAAREFMKLEEQAIRFKRVYGDTFTPSGETDKMVEQIKGLADAYTTYGLAVEKTMSLAADAAAMGKTGADLLAQVDQASKLAVLGGVDQEKALETTISLTSAFGTATRDLAKDINFLNAVENQTVTSIDDLTTAIPTAAPVIQQLGGDVKDLAFFLTAMREGGINASEGANALKSGLASMINPTTAATEMLAKFGVNLQGIVDGNKGNVKQMIVDLGLALDGLDPTNRAQAIEQLFGKFQFARMSTLFQNVIKDGTQAGRVLELTAKSASELAILSERELKRVSDSPLYKFEAALEKFQAALAPVGEAFLKLVTPILEWAKTIIDSFNNLGSEAKNFIMILVGAVAGLGPILLMGFGLIANGAANVIKGLMGLFNFFKRLGGQSKILGEQTKYMSQEQLNAMAAAASLEQAHMGLTQAFTSEAAAVRQLISSYDAAVVAQNRLMSSGGKGGKARPPVKKAKGGMVYGPGTGTSDSIPAMLSNGEAVIPAEAVRKNPGLVNGLISGKIRGFAEGTAGAAGKSAVVAFGAYQPFTIAHESIAMMGQEMARAAGTEFIQAASAGSKDKRSILSQAERSSMIEESIGQKPLIAKNPFDLMEKLAKDNITQVKLLVGQDRAESKVWMQAAEAAKIKLETVSVPRPEGSVSGTAARAAAASGDYPGFKGMLASGVSDATAQSVFGRLGGPTMPTMSIGDAKKKAGLYKAPSGIASQTVDKNWSTLEAEKSAVAKASKNAGASQLQQDNLLRRQASHITEDISQVDVKGKNVDVKNWKAKNLIADMGYVNNYLNSLKSNSVILKKFEEVHIDQAAKELGMSIDEVQVELDNFKKGIHPTTLKSSKVLESVAATDAGYQGKAVKAGLSVRNAGDFYSTIDSRSYDSGKDKAIASQVQTRVKRLMTLVGESVEKGAQEAAKIASPSKRGKAAGKNIADSILSPVEAASARAKSAGTKMADRVVNTNPAFGRVPQVAPVITPGMKQYIGEQLKKKMPGGAFSATQIKEMGIPKLSGDFSILKTNIRNMSNELTLAKTPMTMLKDATVAAKTGLATAATSMKDFSVNAATKVSTAVKNMATSARQAATGIGNSAKQIALSAGQGIAGAPGKVGKFMTSGKGAGIGMGASMGLMMAQGVEGPVGQIAGAVSGPLMILSTIGPMLAGLPAPILAVVGVLGLFAFAIGASIQQYNDGIKKATELGNALGTSAKSLKSFAEATGNVTAGELEMRSRSERQGGVSTSGKVTFGQAYLEQDQNKEQVTAIQESINKVGKVNAEDLLVSKMANAVASGAMNAVDARSVVSAIATEMGDTTFGMDVNGQLIELLGPNGENLAKDPIGVRVKIIEDTKESWSNVLDTIQNPLADTVSAALDKTVDSSKTKYDSETKTTSYFDAEGTAIGTSKGVGDYGRGLQVSDASGKVVKTVDMATTATTNNAGNSGYEGGTYAQAFSSTLNSIQQALASAKPGEDTAPIIAQQQALYGDVATAVPDLGKAKNDAMVEGLKQNIAGRYEGDAGQQKNAADVANSIIGNANATQTQEAQLLVNLSSDTGLDPATMGNMMKIFGGSTESLQQMLDLQINMDPAQYADLSSVYSQFTDNPEMVQKFQTDVFVKQDKAGQQAITNSLTQISKANSDPKIRRLQLETVMKDKSGATLKLINKRVNDLKKQPKISLQFLAQTNGIKEGTKQFEDLKLKWDAIPEKDQASFAMNFTTNFTTTGDKNNPAYKEWLKTNSGSITDFAASEAQTSITTSTDNTDVGDTGNDDTGDTSGGGGGGSPEPPPRTVVDVIADQQKRITAISDQTSAVRKLVAAGLSLADAYAIASNAEDAALIAHGATAEQLAELTAKTREAEKATKDLAAAQNVSNALTDTKDRNALAARLAADKNLTDIQKRFLLQNADAARLYMTPTLDPAALQQALLDAQNASTYEFNINKVTIPGLQDIWQKGMSNAAAAFSAQQNVIELNFKIQKDPLKDIVEAGQRAISDIQNRAGGLDDLDADLQRIAAKEFEINKAYDEKAKALNEVSRINDRIISQQKSQLGLANALSTGDIAAAARAAQDMQAQASAGSISDQRTALDEARKAEIEGLTGTSGLTREEIEEKVRDLKAQILEIEEQRIEPAQRQMELLDRMKQDQIEALTVLGKTRDEWDSINTSLELANTKTFEFQKSMRQALSIATQLGAALAGATVQSVYKPPPAPKPAPAPAPAARVVDYNDMARRVYRGEYGNGQARINKLRGEGYSDAEISKIQDTVNNNYYASGGLVKYMKKGGKMSYMNAGGMVPYMAMGGIANMLAKGTDTIPAMLTAGEFVMSKPAVDKIGMGRLAELNRGYDRNTNSRSDSVYNYSINVNASTNANPREIAQTVLTQIKQVDAQRIRSNRF